MFDSDLSKNPHRRAQLKILQETWESLLHIKRTSDARLLDSSLYLNAGGLTASLAFMAAARTGSAMTVVAILFASGILFSLWHALATSSAARAWLDSFDRELPKLMTSSDWENPFPEGAWAAFFTAKNEAIRKTKWRRFLLYFSLAAFVLAVGLGILYLALNS